MIIKTFWNNSIPDGTITSDEIITVPEDSPSIQELFERAARGESLGGTYDEFDEDSDIVNRVHDPDLQDPLLREAMLQNDLDTLQHGINRLKTKSKRNKTDTPAFSDNDSMDSSDKSESKGDQVSFNSDK